MNDISALLLQTMVTAAPFAIAALGGLISEYAGRLNIGLEGTMLAGAFCAVAAANGGLGIPGGIVSACLAGALIGQLVAIMNIRGGANIFIIGLSVNLLSGGLVGFAGSWIFKTRSVVAITGDQHRAGIELFFAVVSLFLALVFWLVIRSTRTGFRLRGLGTHEAMLRARGIDTDIMRIVAITVSGVLGGLAGAALSLDLGAFVPNQSSGKGWIALVLVFIGARHPVGVYVSAVLFALVGIVASDAQSGAEHPALFVGLPYLIVLAGLVGVHLIRRIIVYRMSRSRSL